MKVQVPNRKKLFRTVIAVFLTATIATGCDRGTSNPSNPGSSATGDALRALGVDEKTANEIDAYFSKQANVPSDELKKLRQFEYTVRTFPLSATPAQIENQLQEMGKERWDCFHVERTMGEMHVFCKRRPFSPLQYIPRTIIAR